MRNDALDELEQLPSFTPDDRLPAGSHVASGAAAAGTLPRSAARGGALPWLSSGVLLLALAGLGWWSQQQVARLEMQLVATQESFARISEDAAGRLKDISGKVVATESSVTSESEALKLRIRQLESQLAEQGKRLQLGDERMGELARLLERLGGELQRQQGADEQLLAAQREQQGSIAGLQGRLGALADAQAALKIAQDELGRLEGRLQGLAGEVAAVKKQGNPNPAIARLEADLLVLRSQLDSRPAAGGVELDAFRAQMTRNITTLQAQVQDLQRQLDAR
ncbi:ATPase [Pseudomonas stutzeri]|nr:ATPase [Stutzerimonas stutzeri]